jgi:hypothetical protein
MIILNDESCQQPKSQQLKVITLRQSASTLAIKSVQYIIRNCILNASPSVNVADNIKGGSVGIFCETRWRLHRRTSEPPSLHHGGTDVESMELSLSRFKVNLSGVFF